VSIKLPVMTAKPIIRITLHALVVLALTACSRTSVMPGAMQHPREGHAALLLQNGKIILLGGDDSHTAEIFDPDSRKWHLTQSPIDFGSCPSAFELANGSVLVVARGGYGTPPSPLTGAELYDPATDQWTVTDSLSVPRSGHAAAHLSNGTVLVCGGFDPNSNSRLTSAEIYNPSTGKWTATGAMNVARDNCFSAVLLTNKKVLVVGGEKTGTCELFDPATGQWTLTGSLSNSNTGTVTLLRDHRVLSIGYQGLRAESPTAELYNPATGIWANEGPVPSGMVAARRNWSATLLANGKVLVAGGENGGGFGGYPIAKMALFDPATGKWASAGSLHIARSDHSATLLANGKVLITGGDSDPEFQDKPLASVELFSP